MRRRIVDQLNDFKEDRIYNNPATEQADAIALLAISIQNAAEVLAAAINKAANTIANSIRK